MDGTDPDGDDRTFRVNFTGEGVGKLRERVKEKLKELMGDYTDDTLVEYVVVLLRNGRRKDESRKELNVFLGDECVPFVSWLWDHVSSNLHLYVEPKVSFPGDVTKTRSLVNEISGRHDSKPEHLSGSMQTDSEYEKERSDEVSRNRHNREWRGLVQEEMDPFSLRSTLTENFHLEEESHHRTNLVRRSRSPRLQAHRKRSRQDERRPTKRDTTSHPSFGPPRRLLQFAVRDAVRTVQQPSPRMEPVLKRLRSVVSTSTTDSFIEDSFQVTRPVSKVSGAVATALKAAAEAAEDVIKVRCSGNVFGRQGHGMGTAKTIHQPSNFRAPVLEGEFDGFNQIPESSHLDYYQRSESDGELAGDMTMLDRDTGISLDSTSDNDGYGDVGIVRHQSSSFATKNKNSLMVQYSVSQDADGAGKRTRLMDQDPPTIAAGNASRKIVNISVNVNTWKPPHYGNPRNVTEVENLSAGEEGGVSAGKLNVRLNNTAVSEKENDAACADVRKEVQKTVASTPGLYSTGRPDDDVDSRIIFVSNVHFAATKDTLSRHFNKFGEVLKVIIVTDAATGQPKGSAFVEFLRKESAEQALSLNGTSFMSRILKVVRRSAARHEAAPLMVWPRIARASPFASRLGRVAFPRSGLPGAFRAHLPVKPGARSFQWKRDASASLPAEGAKSFHQASLPGRKFTYTRTI